MCVCMHICTCMYVCMYVRMYVFLCVMYTKKKKLQNWCNKKTTFVCPFMHACCRFRSTTICRRHHRSPQLEGCRHSGPGQVVSGQRRTFLRKRFPKLDAQSSLHRTGPPLCVARVAGLASGPALGESASGILLSSSVGGDVSTKSHHYVWGSRYG